MREREREKQLFSTVFRSMNPNETASKFAVQNDNSAIVTSFVFGWGVGVEHKMNQVQVGLALWLFDWMHVNM